MKEEIKSYASDVGNIIKEMLQSQIVKFSVAGGVVGLVIGSALGVPTVGLYVGFGLGLYHGVTK